jgi:hypothetical protein
LHTEKLSCGAFASRKYRQSQSIIKCTGAHNIVVFSLSNN